MKSVGEVMAIGRTFAESLQKALRGLETGLTGSGTQQGPTLKSGSQGQPHAGNMFDRDSPYRGGGADPCEHGHRRAGIAVIVSEQYIDVVGQGAHHRDATNTGGNRQRAIVPKQNQ